MKTQLFSVYDKIAKDFGPIYQQINAQAASRSFQAGAKNQPNTEDFSLYYMGDYDTVTGKIDPNRKPIFITDVVLVISHGETNDA